MKAFFSIERRHDGRRAPPPCIASPALREMSANIRVLFVSYPGRTIVCMSEFDFLSSSVVHRAAVVAGGWHLCRPSDSSIVFMSYSV